MPPEKGIPPRLPGPAVDEEIDLHGLAVDEAMVQVELAMDRYRRRAGACIRVIHGIGTGGPDTIKATLNRRLQTVWKGRILSFRPEPGNPGSTLIRPG